MKNLKKRDSVLSEDSKISEHIESEDGSDDEKSVGGDDNNIS